LSPSSHYLRYQRYHYYLKNHLTLKNPSYRYLRYQRCRYFLKNPSYRYSLKIRKCLYRR
jgi:hypothetical protein